MINPGKWIERKALDVMNKDSLYRGFQQDFIAYIKDEHEVSISDAGLSNMLQHGFGKSMFKWDILGQWAQILECSKLEICIAHGLVEPEADVGGIVLTDSGAEIVEIVKQLTISGDTAKLKLMSDVIRVLLESS